MQEKSLLEKKLIYVYLTPTVLGLCRQFFLQKQTEVMNCIQKKMSIVHF
jgi:hypothetical protein